MIFPLTEECFSDNCNANLQIHANAANSANGPGYYWHYSLHSNELVY